MERGKAGEKKDLSFLMACHCWHSNVQIANPVHTLYMWQFKNRCHFKMSTTVTVSHHMAWTELPYILNFLSTSSDKTGVFFDWNVVFNKTLLWHGFKPWPSDYNAPNYMHFSPAYPENLYQPSLEIKKSLFFWRYYFSFWVSFVCCSGKLWSPIVKPHHRRYFTQSSISKRGVTTLE